MPRHGQDTRMLTSAGEGALTEPYRNGTSSLSNAVLDDLIRHTPTMDPTLLADQWQDEADALRQQLGFEDAPLAERMLIEQVLLCYIRLHVTEFRHLRVDHGPPPGDARPSPFGGYEPVRMTIQQADWWERRLNAAHRRFDQAIETLARVRRLTGRPTVQINVATAGGQQVITGG